MPGLKSDLIVAIKQLAVERGVSKEAVLRALEEALLAAYRRDAGKMATQKLAVQIDPQSGQAKLYVEKEVVDAVQDPANQLSLAEAGRLKPGAEVGQTVLVETTPNNFGRIAAQTAKQVVLQRLREAERERVYQE
ncbi:MAG: transcription termination/antitermination protein NusA, partial [Chloroflexi bacterium]|nr:transcription termination/antitermination protein NusA [Chloroflexota bacterium]